MSLGLCGSSDVRACTRSHPAAALLCCALGSTTTRQHAPNRDRHQPEAARGLDSPRARQRKEGLTQVLSAEMWCNPSIMGYVHGSAVGLRAVVHL